MIEVRNLTKCFGTVRALDRVSFTARPGAVTGLLGPNGAGKTTALRLIMGLDVPTLGEARVRGRRYSDLPAPLREVGALLDARAVHSSRRAHDHLLCLAQSNGLPRWRVDEVLQLVGLEHVAHQRVGTFSQGMVQRLGIAAALLGDPEVLLFDEPANGLDPEGIAWIRTLTRTMADEGRTVLVSSHLISEISLIAEQVVVIGRGRLLAASPTLALTRSNRPRVHIRTHEAESHFFGGLLVGLGATVRPGLEGGLVVSGLDSVEIFTLAADHGVALSELSPRQPTLEETYMELTQDSMDFAIVEGAA